MKVGFDACTTTFVSFFVVFRCFRIWAWDGNWERGELGVSWAAFFFLFSVMDRVF